MYVCMYVFMHAGVCTLTCIVCGFMVVGIGVCYKCVYVYVCIYVCVVYSGMYGSIL